MEKSVYSKKLEKIASGVEGTYPDFVTALGIIPQRRGVDADLLEWAEAQEALTYDSLAYQYALLCYGTTDEA